MSSLRCTSNLLDLQNLGYEASTNETFKNSFVENIHANRRLEMIMMLLEIPKIGEFPIRENYRAKNNDRAKALFEQSTSLNTEAKTEALTKAFFAASYGSKLFFQILLERARSWYEAGKFLQCTKDCQYLINTSKCFKELLSNNVSLTEFQMESFLLRAECCKKLGLVEDSKMFLNEAMHIINELAKIKADENSDAFKLEKLRLLKPFLDRKEQLCLEPRNSYEDKTVQFKAETPKLKGKVDKFLAVCSDAVTLGKNETRGRFLYATRNIKPGSVLIIDRPFSFSTELEALHRNCLLCHTSLLINGNVSFPCKNCQTVSFCSESCFEKAWNKFHKYECQIFDYFFEENVKGYGSQLQLAYRTTVAAILENEAEFQLNEELLHKFENQSQRVNSKSIEKYEPENYKTVLALETHCVNSNLNDNTFRAINSIFLAKCLLYCLRSKNPEMSINEKHLLLLSVMTFHHIQAVNCNAYEIVENIRNEETNIFEPRNVGGAIYTSVSLTNHSCYPNIVRHSFPCGTVVVRSIRFIPQGSEILDCYGQHFLETDTHSRRKCLAKKYYFDCQCEACQNDWHPSLSLLKLESRFKCSKCLKQYDVTSNVLHCPTCKNNLDLRKVQKVLHNSTKKRLDAIDKMYAGKYEEALPLLLEHASYIDKILMEPNLESVKTQQSIIQCFNATSCISK